MASRILSDGEIAGAAKAGGFTGRDIVTAVAVALAESGGNANTHNAVPPDNSYGLMQINMIGSLGPARRKTFGISSNEALYDPVTNMRAARKIRGGSRGWANWTTFTSGRYLQYMSRAKAAAGNPADAPQSNVEQAGNPLDPLKDLNNLFGMLSSGAVWIRLGVVLAGVFLLYLSFNRLTGINLIPKVEGL